MALTLNRWDYPLIHVNDVPQDDKDVTVMHPSVLRVDGLIGSPLGRYYMWFAGHNNDYVRLAYADTLSGPWTVRTAGTDLTLARLEAVHGSLGDGSEHLGSPSVVWDGSQFVMTFHARLPAPWGHCSGMAWSDDGLEWTIHTDAEIIDSADGSGTYLRLFQVGGDWFGVANFADLYKADEGSSLFDGDGNPTGWTRVTDTGNWAGAIRPTPQGNTPRHCAPLNVSGSDWTLFFTERAGSPHERIIAADWDASGDWQTWSLTNRREFATVTEWWEGTFETETDAQLSGWLDEPEHCLRDPAPFVDNDGRMYLFYCGAGEHWIGGGELVDS